MWYVLVNEVPVLEPDMLKAAEFFNDISNRRVAEDHIDDVQISTVFLGIDHGFGRGIPICFETMIFGGVHDQYQRRYTTVDEAREGHKEAVDLVKASLPQEPSIMSLAPRKVKI